MKKEITLVVLFIFLFFSLNGAIAQTLLVSKSGSGGGNVESSPAGINCGSICSADFSSGVIVTLNATATSDSYLSSWVGCNSVNGSECIVSMDSNKNVTAVFEDKIVPEIEITVVPSKTVIYGTRTNVSGTGCPAGLECVFTRNNGIVTNPDSSRLRVGRYTYRYGTQGNYKYLSESVTAVVNVEENGTETVLYLVKVYKNGDGIITSNPVGISCGTDCVESFRTVTNLNLTATSYPGSVFNGWSGDCSGRGNCLLRVDSNKNATATFFSLFNAPFPAANLTVRHYSQGKARLLWTDTSTNEEGFRVYRSFSPTSNYSLIGTTGPNVTYFFDKAFIAGLIYYYKVKSFNSFNASIDSNIVFFDTSTKVPLTPSNLEARALSTDSIELKWKNLLNNSDGIVILRSDDLKKPFYQMISMTAGSESYVDKELEPDHNYYYRIYSHNLYANSPSSLVIIARTKSCGIFYKLLSLEC